MRDLIVLCEVPAESDGTSWQTTEISPRTNREPVRPARKGGFPLRNTGVSLEEHCEKSKRVAATADNHLPLVGASQEERGLSSVSGRAGSLARDSEGTFNTAIRETEASMIRHVRVTEIGGRYPHVFVLERA